MAGYKVNPIDIGETPEQEAHRAKLRLREAKSYGTEHWKQLQQLRKRKKERKSKSGILTSAEAAGVGMGLGAKAKERYGH